MRNSYVLGFSGKIGSGKTTLSSQVAEVLGFERVSFGDYVREVAQERGLDITRDVLQQIGEILISEDCSGFCQKVLSRANWSPGKSLIIDGVRHLSVLQELKKIVLPSRFYLIVITLPDSNRVERLKSRGEFDPENQRKTDSHSTEQDFAQLLANNADLQIDGTKNLEELVAIVAEWARSLDFGATTH